MSSYTLSFSDSTKADTVTVPAMPPGINTVDTSLSLIGRGYPNYGEKISENFLHLLENFSSSVQPENPIEGQLWYDTSDPTNKVLRVMDGTNWPNVSGIYQQTSDPKDSLPVGLKTGDIWVDTASNQLKIFYSGNWTLVGPPSTSTNTGAVPEYITDTSGNKHWVIKNYVDSEVISVISGDTFSPNPVISGFVSLTTGTNLVSGSILKGTADVASNLLINGAVYAASAFLRKNDSAGQYITGKVIFQTPSNQTGSEGRDGVVILKSNDSTSEYIQFYKYGDNAIIANNKIGGKINLKTRGTSDPIATDTVTIDKTSVNVKVTTEAVSTTSGALVVTGGVAIGGNLYIGNKLYVNEINLTTATISLLNTTASTTTNTGALTVAGGVGIGGNLNVGKIVKLYSTAASTSTNTGALLVAGGVGIGGGLSVGGRIYAKGYITSDSFVGVGTSTINTTYIETSRVEVTNGVRVYGTTAATSTTTGALIVAGGAGIGGSLYVGGEIVAQKLTIELTTITTTLVKTDDIIQTYNATASTSTTTGALLVTGGVGIGGSVNIGSTSTIAGARILTTATNPDIVIPESFGAKGDGATNDYVALQAAIDTGKSVYLSDGKTYYYTTGLTINNNYQRFGGPGVLKPSGSINGVTIGGGSEGVEVDLTFNAPNLAGSAVRIANANRVTIKKLHGVNVGISNTSSSVLYVQQANTVVVDWLWAVTGGKGITWYGSDSLRSDILRINFAVLDCADDQYGLDWDGNCHSLEIGYLGLVGTKGAIIRNTYKDSNPSATTFPAIGRFNHIEIDYPTSHGIEITSGLDYDFNIPYIIGAGFSISSPGKSGIKIGSSINSYQVRINGGKSIGNTGYGIENAGGIVYSDGTTDLSNNTLGRTTGTVWTTLERLTLDDDNFYLTMNSGNPLMAVSSTSTVSYDRATDQLNFTIATVGALKIDKTYVQALKPLITPTYTVGTLPSGLQGMRAFVSDANTSTFYSVAASGGSYMVPVYYTGSEWRIG